MSELFSSFQIGQLALENRIVIPAMCQYSAEHGMATDWHHQHFATMLQSGAGLFIIEATSVLPEGRISPADLGLWNDDCKNALKDVLERVKQYSDMPIGIQLAHAGRKASMSIPWKGNKQLHPQHGGWQTFSVSEQPYSADQSVPHALNAKEIKQLIQAFVDAAKRAEKLDIDLIEIHAAHGYLIHQFLSPLSNIRHDEYGGEFDNRVRLLMEIFTAIKSAISNHIALGVRISATDWVEGGWDLEQSIALAKLLKASGCDFIDVSSGGLSPLQQIALEPHYQVPLAQAIKSAVPELPTITAGLITDPQAAEKILTDQQADLVGIARGILYNPRWPWHAAAELNAQIKAAPQYLRSAPLNNKTLFKPDN